MSRIVSSFALGLACLCADLASGQPGNLPLQSIEIKVGGGVPQRAVAAGIGGSLSVVSCLALKDATSIEIPVGNKRQPMQLVAARILENICVLQGAESQAPKFASRDSIRPGTKLRAMLPPDNPSSNIRELEVEIRDKTDGGTSRFAFFAAGGESIEGAPLFAHSGEFAGIATSIRGKQGEYAFALLESVDHVQGLPRLPAVAPAKGQTRQVNPSVVLTSQSENIGLVFSLDDLASYYSRTRNYEKAILLSDRWKTIDPQNPAALIVAAGSLSRLSFLDNALRDVEKALALDGQYLPALMGKISLLATAGRNTEAELLASKALQLRSSDGIDMARMVTFLIVAKRREDALAQARTLIQREPNASYTRFALCMAESLDERGDGAIDACKAYVELQPDSVTGWVRLSAAYLRKGRQDDAIASAKKALSISIEAADAWRELGLASELKGDVATGSEAERRIAEYDEKSLQRYKASRTIATCDRDIREKAYTKATSSCQEAVQLNERSAAAFTRLGYALLRDKRLDEGIAAHERAIGLDPKRTASLSDLCYAYAQKRDYAKARSLLEQLALLDRKAADEVAQRIKLPST